MLRRRGGFLVKCSLLLETLTCAHTNTMSPVGNWVGERGFLGNEASVRKAAERSRRPVVQLQLSRTRRPRQCRYLQRFRPPLSLSRAANSFHLVHMVVRSFHPRKRASRE